MMKKGAGFKIGLGVGILLLLVAFVLPQVALAVETQPCRFWGTVKVNGNPVADGTLITAWIDGAVGSWSASTSTADGKSVYWVDVPAAENLGSMPPKDGGIAGDTVRFKVRYGGNDYVAAQTGVWAVGEYPEVNLVISLVTATLSGQPTGLVNYRTANITVAGTGVVAYKYKLDGGTWGTETPVGTHIVPPDLSDGLRTVYVIGKDALGNWQAEAAVTTASWTVDATPPTATLSGQPTGAVKDKTADITVGGTGVVAYRYKLDAGSWIGGTDGIAVSTHIVLSSLSDGAHTVSVIGKDTAGNWQAEGSATSASWTVDTIPPTAALSGQPTGWVNQKTADITVGGAGVVAYKYKLDSGTWSAERLVSTQINLSGLGDGTHTVSVVGKDTAGNWQAEGSATTAGWTIETTLPTITVARNGTTFNGTATDASSFIASVKYQLDGGGGWINATASDGSFNGPSEAYSFTIAAPPDGTHTVEVKATDAAGNASTPQSLSFDSKQLYLDGNEGWNSVAYLGPDKPVSEALSSIWDKLTVVWFYDSESGTWHGYNPHVPAWANDLSGLVNGQPYWIRVTGQCYWTYGG
jgi:hypothetical protein